MFWGVGSLCVCVCVCVCVRVRVLACVYYVLQLYAKIKRLHLLTCDIPRTDQRLLHQTLIIQIPTSISPLIAVVIVAWY